MELIELGKLARGKGAIKSQMILNHKSAIELRIDNINTASFDRYTLLSLPATLAVNRVPNRSMRDVSAGMR